MKKNRLLILLISLLCCLVFVFSACGGDGGENNEEPEPTVTLTYELNTTKTGYIVTGDSGQSTAIVIPAEHEGLPVVEIADSAFAYSKHNSDIISVTIPDTVTTIGKNAFYSRQSDLTTVNIGENSELKTIGNNAFSGCRALKSIWLPDSVTSIGDSAFNNCGSLNIITVASGNTVYSSEGNNLIEIETHTLIRGSNSSVIPSTVTTIAQAAFRRATLTTLTIPVSVTSIGNYIIQDSAVTSIIYEGTAEQWEAVEKTKYWNMGKTDIEVTCSEITEMYIYVGYNRLAVTLAENSAVDALIEILKQGDITYTSHANDFEIYGDIRHNLGTDNNAQMTSEPGDVLLYIGSNICIFFDNNSWSYTRIGKIEGYTASQLKSILAPSSIVQVTISLK
ncbi:MAG: leucine-rich repeat protein [Clostridiales bacterium]|nr:leucine-rich repeat protein [Clostridiales bacterium]